MINFEFLSDVAIKIENVGKQYRLGLVATGTLSHDLNRWWKTTILRQEDPYLKIGETNDRTTKGSSDYVWALKDINMEIKKGDVVGIIGKNGAGKSTLLKLLSRVTTPTTGTIKAHGRIGSLLEVGTGFHPEMTGRENIYMNGAILGMNKQEITRKFDEIVDFSGCERYIDTPVKRYSSGMMVRLGFAVAAHLDPEILIVDEVLAVGDAEFQKKAIGKMQDVSKGEGRTVLFVSHNMASVESLCKSCVWLQNGMVEAIGVTKLLVDQYRKSNFLSFEKYNFFERKRLAKPTYISDFQIKNSKDSICYDTVLSFCVKIRASQKKTITIRIAMFDLNENRVMAFDSSKQGVFFEIDADRESVCFCDMYEPLNLKPGRYVFNVSIRQGADLLDHIKNVDCIDIYEKDYEGHGVFDISDTPLCLKKYKWYE